MKGVGASADGAEGAFEPCMLSSHQKKLPLHHYIPYVVC